MIVLNNVDDLKRSVSAISTFINEANVRFNEKGISLKAVDPSQIVLVDFLLEKKFFGSFDVEPNLVGVDLGEFNKILQRAQHNDVLELSLKDSEIIIDFKGDFDRTFNLPLIDISGEEAKTPALKFDAELTLNAKTLKEALKDASLFGSSALLRVKGNKFMVEAKGSNGKLRAVATNAKNVKVKDGKEVVSKFSLNFLINILKDLSNEEDVFLFLKNEDPMRLSFKIGNSEFVYHLANMVL